MQVACVVVAAQVLAGIDDGVASHGDVVVVAVGAAPLRPQPPRLLVVEPEGIGMAEDDPRTVLAAMALAGAQARETVAVADPSSALARAAAAAGVEVASLEGDRPGLAQVVAIARRRAAALERGREPVGVGPHPEPWPNDPRLDPDLLAAGDRRNVVDRYRYWREAAIVADLDATRAPVHVAVENWRHDLNIGTVVRNANAFNVAGVHIVGKRRWNRRGAMATDRYLHVHHHATVADLVAWSAGEGLALVGIDNRPGALPIEETELPDRGVLVLGQEGPGLSPEMAGACSMVCQIAQFGSTRSLNAGVASGIALHVWLGQRWPRSGPVL